MSDPQKLHTSGLSPASSTSTIRPRKGRLISGLDEPGDIFSPGNVSSNLLGSPAVSPRPSRAPSPLPSQHPSRLLTAPGSQSQSNGRPLGGLGAGSSSTTPTSLASGFLGSSWTALQGLASNVLGSDTFSTNDSTSRTGRSPFRKRKSSIGRARAVSATPPNQWGPAGASSPQIRGGSQASREAQIRAKKREELLSNGNGSNLTDSTGKYKRRLSDDRNGVSSSAPPSEADRDEGDAMVYVYHVQPDDTLAGIVLKFSCQITPFRRVNRLWPNDSIQSRKVVLVPAEACSIKGRPCSPPHESTRQEVQDEKPKLSPQAESSTWPGPQPHIRHSSSTSNSSTAAAATAPNPWQHQSYVLLPTISTPISLARLPRKSLNYFPPRRRLSQTSSTLSTTPSHSFDLTRSPNHHAASSPSAPTTRLNRANSSSFYAHLTGPGGVGSLHPSSSNPHIPPVPGPAPDNLNKYLAPHLPSVTPPADSEFTISSNPDPLPGIENVGAAIEGWMRKMAARAQGALEPPKARLGRSAVSDGDLIELSAGFEGTDLLDTEEERGRYRADSGEGTGRMQPGKSSTRGRKGVVSKED